MGVPPAWRQDAGEEVRAGRPVDGGDQQPFSRSCRALPGQEQEVHFILAVRVPRETRHLPSAAGASRVAGYLRPGACPAGAGGCRSVVHGQSPPQGCRSGWRHFPRPGQATREAATRQGDAPRRSTPDSAPDVKPSHTGQRTQVTRRRPRHGDGIPRRPPARPHGPQRHQPPTVPSLARTRAHGGAPGRVRASRPAGPPPSAVGASSRTLDHPARPERACTTPHGQAAGTDTHRPQRRGRPRGRRSQA
jgi:hypothetical protein